MAFCRMLILGLAALHRAAATNCCLMLMLALSVKYTVAEKI